jgi:hypothetical protein
MKARLILFILAFGLAGTFSALTYSIPTTSALLCDLHINPYGGGVLDCESPPDDLPRSFSNTWPEYGHSGMNNIIFMLNPQPLPPVDCPMCGAVVLDKSLFDSGSEIKISPQKDGSIKISAIMSNNATGSNTTNSSNLY